VAGYLFVPSGASVDQFFAEASAIKQKPPYSFIVGFQDAWNNAASSSHSVAKIALPWSVMSASTSLVLVSSASFTRWVSSDTWSTVRGFTTGALWFAFGWFLWGKGRNILARL